MATEGRNKSGTKDSRAERLMEILDFAYSKNDPAFTRMKVLQKSHDNVVNPKVFPTNSKMPVASAFTQVEEALGPAMDYLLGTGNPIRLNPDSVGVSIDNIRNAEWAIYNMVANRMRIADEAYAVVRDSFKLGLGYGIVEPITVTPPRAFSALIAEGNTVTTHRAMRTGSTRKSLRFRWVSPGAVIAYPDGCNCNGTSRSSMIFLIDFYSEREIEALYSSQPTDGENYPMEGSAQEVIDSARKEDFKRQYEIAENIRALSGVDLTILQERKHSSDMPITIPVIKVYEPNHHTWLGNGKVVMLDQADKFQTMRCPLSKWSAHRDGKRWFPMSTAEALEKANLGHNIWVNLVYDLMTYAAKRPMAYSTQAHPSGPPKYGPDDSIGLDTADVRNGAMFLDGPGIGADTLSVGDRLSAMQDKIRGQQPLNQPGFVRGGMMAFQELLSSTTARQRLAGAILQSGGVEPVYHQAMIYMQGGIGLNETVPVREINEKDNSEYVNERTVTEEDLLHAYTLTLDLGEKFKAGMMEAQNKFPLYDRQSKSPYFDQYQVAVDLCDNESQARRQVLPREVVERKQAEAEAADLRAREQGLAQGGTETSPAQQAVQGATEGGI